MLVAWLAWRDLMRDRFFLFCNVAIMVGVLVPLLVLFGVKNGVYQALIGQMLANPATLQIDSVGNRTLTEAEIAPIRDWPEVAFVTPRTRSLFDQVNVRPQDGRRMRAAILIPSGAGDPSLPAGFAPTMDSVAVSPALARNLDLAPGSGIDLVTQAEGRPRQLRLAVTVGAILDEIATSGDTILAPFELLDLIEAFYDAYALPDHGITAGRPLAERVPVYQGVRLYARELEGLAALQTRVEGALGLGTRARTREVQSLLGLGRNLDRALLLTAATAGLGMIAALVFAFWTEVMRKRGVLASLAMLGLSGPALALFPLIQAGVTAVIGLALSGIVYLGAARVAAMLFGAGLPEGAALTLITPGQMAAIGGGVLALVVIAAGLSAWGALRLDPARVLREGA
jgi:putative ABC transport system permease protein